MNILSVTDLSLSQVDRIVMLAHKVLKEGISPGLQHSTKNKIVGILFDQPSHRTQNSFISAAYRLDARILNLKESYNDSQNRGELFPDFWYTAQTYIDCMIYRSSRASMVNKISKLLDVPFINAGNGRDEHPTQALTDFSVLKSKIKKLNGLPIAFIGSLRDSRCAKSLSYLLALFGAKILMVCPKHLRLSERCHSIIVKRGASIEYSEKISDALNCKVLYFTGSGLAEDFADPLDRTNYMSLLTLNLNMFQRLSSDSLILHPLPRGSELPYDPKSDHRFQIYEQVRHGVAIRAAILALVFNTQSPLALDKSDNGS
jgi:aspartate carbamoyltransferase